MPDVNPPSTGTHSVVDLHGARRARRLDLYRNRLNQRQQDTRSNLVTLYEGGTLFTPDGTQQGRSLLKALQLLQRAGTRLEELSGDGLLPAPSASERIDALYDEVDGLFTKCDRLTGRGTASVARLPRG
ncbi:hypothetical protein D7Y27_06790 [Corallococcus sp. AB004]|uniref:Uncharacterized protein n=1 Tax=Corallococcus exiguus TaxID=83462 RepID=A0A7X4Y9H9_9BACT|nr:hypothetical protein [Corallococcus exiguus]RKH98912.1 hypothetical protein D7Y04_23520 [Corallococcus sp. AB038B]RKI47153.1 hypothetical protein D7Y27_06790 [Corallococcus sp. AB004]NPC68616.1 hypothetical protein [Corallococcus exiguus]NPD23229.1 hypothetical protein [Corallococcus exiguus]